MVLATGGGQSLKDMSVDRSFMERAIDAGAPVHKLRVQYRMPEVLRLLVSRLFYGGELRTGSPWLDVAFGGLRVGPRALRWFNVSEEERSIGNSKATCAEVSCIAQLLERDTALKSPEAEVMVITLYKPQAALLLQVLRMCWPHRISPIGRVQVVTVDAAQVSEAQHVVLSTVRSNPGCNIGFARNPRRLCVALSRAKESLTIVGDRSVMSGGDAQWAKVSSAFAQDGEVCRAQHLNAAWELAN